MSEIAIVLYDLGILSILLLLGVFLRKNVKLFQNVYIPASLLAAFAACFSDRRCWAFHWIQPALWQHHCQVARRVGQHCSGCIFLWSNSE